MFDERGRSWMMMMLTLLFHSILWQDQRYYTMRTIITILAACILATSTSNAFVFPLSRSVGTQLAAASSSSSSSSILPWFVIYSDWPSSRLRCPSCKSRTDAASCNVVKTYAERRDGGASRSDALATATSAAAILGLLGGPTSAIMSFPKKALAEVAAGQTYLDDKYKVRGRW